MKVIGARSPYTIEINEANQIGSKLEIFIWHKGETEPTTPTHTLSKSISSIADRKNIYNISQYILENIKTTSPTYVTAPAIESNDVWCFVKVKKYKLIGSTYTLVDTTNFIGVDGYTNYMGGANNLITDQTRFPLYNNLLTYSYATNYGYFNILIEGDAEFPLNVVYTGVSDIDIFMTAGEVYNYKIPFVSSGTFAPSIVLTQEDTFLTLKVEQICEPKYTPIVCSFINRFGGWEFLTFFKANQQSIEVKSSDLKLMSDSWDYNPLVGTTKSFNFNGMQKITCNTGFIDENKFQLIQDLLVSQTILLDNVPVICKTKSVDYKTRLKDRNINYTIGFEYNFNLINDAI